jgi:hypothetical protein
MTRANFGDKGHMQAYYILQEDPSVAGVKSAQIFYFYRKGRFCRVDVDWSGAESDAAVITAVLNREWGKPDEDTVHEGFISRKWVSRDGKTAAFLSRVDNLKTHDTGLPHLVIADLKCVAEAVNDPGL